MTSKKLGWQSAYAELWTMDVDGAGRSDILNDLSESQLRALYHTLFPAALTSGNLDSSAGSDELRAGLVERLFDNSRVDYILPKVRVAWLQKSDLPMYISRHTYFVHHMLMKDYPSQSAMYANPLNGMNTLLHQRRRRVIGAIALEKARRERRKSRVDKAVKAYRSMLMRAYLSKEAKDVEVFKIEEPPEDAQPECCPACMEMTAPPFMVHFDCGLKSNTHGMCILCTHAMRRRSTACGIACPMCRHTVTKFYGNRAAAQLLFSS